MRTELFLEMKNLEKDHWWFRARREIISDFLIRYIGKKNKVAQALDIGCGTGFNMKVLLNYAEVVDGLDESEWVIDFNKKDNPNFKIFKSKFPDFNQESQYQLITLFDVLEHIENDIMAIKQIEKMLKPGGKVLFTVPSFTFLWSKHDILFGHYRRYCKKELKKIIMNNTNLEIMKISHFNTFLFPIVVFFRIIKKIFKLKGDNSDFFYLPNWLNNLLAKIFGAEKSFLRFINFPFGVSIICVLKKNR